MSDLQYPIGRFSLPGSLSEDERRQAMGEIAALPGRLRAAVEDLSEVQLDTPYRPDGWTVRQVVHHVPDSHLNAYVRFKLALTEDEPTIRPYDEKEWARLPDAAGAIEVSLVLLDALHERWVRLLEALPESAWRRPLRHPEMERPLRLDELLALYAWHGRHHVAHVTALRQREGWS